MNRVVVFAQAAPRTLSPALPSALAAGLHAALLADTLAAVADAAAPDERMVAWGSPGEARPVPAGFGTCVQRHPGPGERLADAFETSLRAIGDRAVVVTAPLAGLDAAHVDAAFDALATHDLALAQRSDGEPGLVALARPAGALFRDLPWGTDAMPAATLDLAGAQGLRSALLPALATLATPADVAALAGELATGTAACGPRTREALRAMGLAP